MFRQYEDAVVQHIKKLQLPMWELAIRMTRLPEYSQTFGLKVIVPEASMSRGDADRELCIVVVLSRPSGDHS